MINKAHFKVPWTITHDMYGVGNVQVWGVRCGTLDIANCGSGTDGQDAAMLIAATPALYSILNLILHDLDTYVQSGHAPASASVRLQLARAAIDLAEGRL